jgi:Ser/Thr protein kinase RdoA (MazF antagonist)
MKIESTKGFQDLTPDHILNTIEKALGVSLTGLITPLPSYINRVYELETVDRERIVAKFYRPGRWTREAILDEHDFILSCFQQEIPVVSPLKLVSGETLGAAQEINFAVFPKKSGRLFELNTEEDYIRVGAIISRMHQAGSEKEASNRIILDPSLSTTQDIKDLINSGLIPTGYLKDFEKITTDILEIITPLFSEVEKIRIHADCHLGNILDRPGEGLLLIDFDDMAMGPAIHDLWLLLPGSLKESKKEMNLLIEGYEQFRSFNWSHIKLIEALRAMRIIYFLAWCARQVNDFQFNHHFPDWGTEGFWEKEITDLKNQRDEIEEHLN